MRGLSIEDPAAQSRFTLDYRAASNLSIGVEKNGGFGLDDCRGEILPRFNWFISPASSARPGLTLGMTADRLSTPRGTAIFLTASQPIEGTPFTVFASGKWMTDMSRLAFPFGVNWKMAEATTLQAVNDAEYTHLILTQAGGPGSASFILARMKHPGLMISVGF